DPYRRRTCGEHRHQRQRQKYSHMEDSGSHRWSWFDTLPPLCGVPGESARGGDGAFRLRNDATRSSRLSEVSSVRSIGVALGNGIGLSKARPRKRSKSLTLVSVAFGGSFTPAM